MTQQELLAALRRDHPENRYAASRDGKAIGQWVDAWGRFAMIVSLALTGEWVAMPWELLINGEPPYAPGDWAEGPGP